MRAGQEVLHTDIIEQEGQEDLRMVSAVLLRERDGLGGL
jgi:hypothetical protein